MNAQEKLVDRKSPIPAYHQILNSLLERIDAGEWDINDKLPSEPALAAEYGVSRITVRQAMAELERRHIIIRYQGKGAFLIGMTKPFVEDLKLPMVSVGGHAASRTQNTVLELRCDDEPPAYVRAAFEQAGQPVRLIYLRRIFSKDGYPIGLNHAWLPAPLVPGIIEQGLLENSISLTLRERYGHRIVKIDNSMEATKANVQEAGALSIAYDTALLKIVSGHYNQDGTLIQFSNTLWVGELTRFRFIAK